MDVRVHVCVFIFLSYVEYCIYSMCIVYACVWGQATFRDFPRVVGFLFSSFVNSVPIHLFVCFWCTVEWLASLMLPNVRRFVMWHTFNDKNKQNDGAKNTQTTEPCRKDRFSVILSHHSHRHTHTSPLILSMRFVCLLVSLLLLAIRTP